MNFLTKPATFKFTFPDFQVRRSRVTALKTGFILIALFLGAQLASAVPNFKDTTEVYDYWSRRGTIEVVDAFIKDYLASSDTSISKKEYLLTYLFRQKFLIDIESNSTVELEAKVQGIGLFLQQNRANKHILDVYKKCVENYNYSRPLTNLYNKAPFLIGDGEFVSEKSQSILNRYSKNLAQFSKGNTMSATNKRMKDTQEKLIVFALGLLAGGFFVYYYSRRKIYSLLKSEKKQYLTELKNGPRKYLFGYIGLFSLLKRSKDLKRMEIDVLRAEIMQFRKSPEISQKDIRKL